MSWLVPTNTNDWIKYRGAGIYKELALQFIIIITEMFSHFNLASVIRSYHCKKAEMSIIVTSALDFFANHNLKMSVY